MKAGLERDRTTDVLSAHELLRDYAGDVHRLFAGGSRAGR